MKTPIKPANIGRNITCIRLLLVMKQEALAAAMGVSLQTIIQIENSKSVEEKQLLKVAKALGVSIEGINSFSEDAVLDHMITTGEKTPNIDTITAIGNNNTDNNRNFNPLDKLIDSYEENKKLYERLLNAEKEKIGYLQKLVDKIKIEDHNSPIPL